MNSLEDRQHADRLTTAMALFESLCDLSAGQQQARVGALSDPFLRAVVQGMLAADLRSKALLSAAQLVLDPLVERGPLVAPVSIGPFVLDEVIGLGGMGEVWRAHSAEDGGAVAIKLIRADRSLNPRFSEAFAAEAYSIAQLNHPNIVPIYDFGTLNADAAQALALPEGKPWLAMAYVPGGNLGAAMRVAVPWPVLRGVLLDLLDALAHAHARRVLHLDIKPANLLIAPTEDGGIRAMLADFGLSHMARSEGVAGTPAFMAPEQRLGDWRAYGPWTDLYAVGVLGWSLLHGEIPGVDARWAPRVEVPESVEGWLRRLMAPDLSARFSHAAEAQSALLGGVAAPSLRASRDEAIPDQEPAPRLTGAGRGLYGLRPLPLIGRAAAREALWAALRSCDRPQAVLLRGNAGVGKSRLARWLCERAAETDRARPFLASAVEEGLDSLRRAITEALQLQGLDGQGRAQALETRLGAGAKAALDWLDAVPGGPPTTPWQILRAEHGPGVPLVLWLDDAHLSMALLRAVAAALRAELGPMLFVLTLQEEALAEAPRTEALVDALVQAGAQTLTLAPLSEQEHQAVIESALPLSPSLAQQVAERTSGNPLFAVQLIGDWVQRGLLSHAPGGFVLSQAQFEMPDSLQRVWRERLSALYADLDPSAEPALELVAALGNRVRLSLWERVCAERGLQIPARLTEALFRRRMASPEGEGIVLAHSLLRDAINAQARAAGRWVEHNNACATVLLQEPLRTVDIRERLIRHLRDSGRHLESAAMRVEAASHHAVGGNGARVKQLLEEWPELSRASEVPDSDPVWGLYWSEIGAWWMTQGRFDLARDAYQQVIDGSSTHGWPNRGEGLYGLSLYHEIRGELQAACALRREALLYGKNPQFEGSWRVDLARLLRALEQLDEARTLLDLVLAMPASTKPELGMRGRALDESAQLHARLGQLDLARTQALEAVETYSHFDNANGLFGVRGTLLLLALTQEDSEEGLVHLTALRQLGARLGPEALRLVHSHEAAWTAWFEDPRAAHGPLSEEIGRARADGAAWILPSLLRTALLSAAAAEDWPCWDQAMHHYARTSPEPIDQVLGRKTLPLLEAQPERRASLLAWLRGPSAHTTGISAV